MTTTFPAITASELALASLRRGRALAEEPMRDWVARLPPQTALTCAYHFGWVDQQGRELGETPGKLLRPALVFAAAEAAGGRARDAIAEAVAVELAHNCSIVHDDVIDHDLIRRHRPTVWAAFGHSAGVLTGDAMFGLAFRALATSGTPRRDEAIVVLDEEAQLLIAGEQVEDTLQASWSVTLQECLAAAQGKTAPMVACATALGAVAGGGSAAQVRELREFGRTIGTAFQVVNDLLDLWGDPAATGKPLRGDLTARKRSLPVIAAITSNTAAGHELLRRLALPAGESGPAENAELAALIEEAGGRAWGQDTAARLLSEALAHLDAADPPPGPREELAALAELIVRRNR